MNLSSSLSPSAPETVFPGTVCELCVLFLHHKEDELTRNHARLIQELNPRALFVPLAFDGGLLNSFRPVREEVSNPWANADLLVYAWFQSAEHIEAKRYLVIEYDTLCTVPFQEFYGEVWDAAAACARIVSVENDPGWPWFNQIPEPALYGKHLSGMSPLSGILLSHSALKAMAHLANAPIFLPLFSECRIGTLASSTGYAPVVIRPDIEEFISWRPRLPSCPGIWHPVKSKVFSSGELDSLLLRTQFKTNFAAG